MPLTIFQWLEDFDDPQLQGYDYDEQLREAVREYNELFGTHHDPDKTVEQYKRRKGSE